MAAHSSILAEKSHGQKSLAGYCPKGHKELDMIEDEHNQVWYTSTRYKWKMFEYSLQEDCAFQ